MRTSTQLVILIAGMFLTGCLEVGTGTEVKQDLNNNNDFSVITEPGNGNGTGGSTGGGDPTAPVPGNDVGEFVVNRGAAMTGSAMLQLEFEAPFHANEMKISENATCEGGDWAVYVAARDYLSLKTNQSVSLSVRYRDFDGIVSDCYTRSIYIDDAGPDIVFAKYPSTTVEEGSDVEIIFNVTDAGAGVASVSCSFGGVSKACAAGQNTLNIPKMASGTYKIDVSATDKLGHSSSKSVSFTVSSLYKQMAQNVKVTENKKVDILFVIDNSGSMAYEQKSMASRVQNFLSVINGLDWQIAVTTTDPRDVTLGDGRLVQLSGKQGQYILTSAMDPADAKATLGATLQRPETGSGLEQGIYVTYRAIERSLTAQGGNVNFVRPDAQLAVVIISDEDESANGAKNDPANLVKFVQSTYGGNKAFSFHSIIARPGDTACLSGEGYAAGHRYDALSKLTGGVIGDVCASDYAAQVQGVAEGVRKTLKTVTLACEPVIDSMRSLLVLKDGQEYKGARTVTGMNVAFDDMLPQGNYEVYYSCLK